MNKRLKKFLRFFVYFHICLAVALLLTHCSFSHYAHKAYDQAKKDKPYDVVIVPGVPYEKEKTTSVMKMRIYWAKHLYDSGFTKNIIFSGSAVYSPYVEGIAMKIIADTLGIPAEHTFSETKAEHSTENVYYSWKMAKQMGFQKIAVATDPYQGRLLKSFAKKYCPGVKVIPIVFDILKMDDTPLPNINYDSAFRKEFVSITVRESFWQRFRYTMGRRIKDELQDEKEKKKREEKEKDNVKAMTPVATQ
ncbi:YdcF family protein [Chryseolinea lacunae]|uniref:YdcF family protein n=1 Tax=Chryseolinea lacunae TaxID=2801331 RepID=A0ABS1KNU7_9BACT|nr:YdcF family protein [Chryseolinea lacunae]MBL0739926.1 YdcF family protein [Chryseolinea lacunae]